MKRIALFVDVQNIYYTTRHTYCRQFNYRQFWKEISEQGVITHAYAYAIERSDDGQRKFQHMLKHLGFDVKLKPYIQRRDGTSKGDWDVGITIDVLETAAEVDKVILLSGDGDFSLLLEKVTEKFQIETHVYGVPELTAQALIKQATSFHPIEASLLL